MKKSPPTPTLRPTLPQRVMICTNLNVHYCGCFHTSDSFCGLFGFWKEDFSLFNLTSNPHCSPTLPKGSWFTQFESILPEDTAIQVKALLANCFWEEDLKRFFSIYFYNSKCLPLSPIVAHSTSKNHNLKKKLN